MNDTMSHRGPDDSGEVIYEIGEGLICGMAHRRLAIMDLSSAGHQPMVSNNHNVTVVFNGEIYNFIQLKKKIPEYSFKSNCDTEVIIAAYEKWGIECFSKFNGMFSIAIFDRQNNELILARDRVGKKPLYYWIPKGGSNKTIVYSSELKPIMAFPGFDEEINKSILCKYLLKGYINAPDSIYENVYKLLPGEILRFNNCITKRKYWDLVEIHRELSKNRTLDLREAKIELNNILLDAVDIRLEADVPLGCFLSGGYDSSLIAAIAQKKLKNKPLETFSIGFNEKEYDEALYAREISKYLGTSHVELYCQRSETVQLVDSIPQYFDEPLADPSDIPTMLVSKLARSHVTTVLSGDGGDELFCGYNHYPMVQKAERYDKIGAFAYKTGELFNLKQLFPYPVRLVADNRENSGKTQLIYRPYAIIVSKMLDMEYDINNYFDDETIYYTNDWEERRMLLDMQTYLPGAVLAKVDRASMKYSLECRSPLLDYRVIEYSLSLDQSIKVHNGVGKYVLKELTYDYIPKKLLDRSKMGFSVPVDSWLRSYFHEQLRYYSSESFLKQQGIFSSQFVHKFIEEYISKGNQGRGKNYSLICWNFYIFQQWYEYYKVKGGLKNEWLCK